MIGSPWLRRDQVVLADIVLLERFPSAVIEDVAVLVDLNQR
jgi:hypothetical protein